MTETKYAIRIRDDIVAEGMTIDIALILVEAIFKEWWQDKTLCVTIEPMEYIERKEYDDFEDVPNCIEMRGEWIYGNGNGECSVCGQEKQDGWDNYCGYCGAKMGG